MSHDHHGHQHEAESDATLALGAGLSVVRQARAELRAPGHHGSRA